VKTDFDAPEVGSATGGTQMVTSTIELRMPSPWRADVMSTAAFVDAGHVSAPGVDLFSTTGVRFTPGFGIRFLTPVGPFRVDLAYNPYSRDAGPLYDVDPGTGGLTLREFSFQPVPPSKLISRFRVQFALGQAF
jgi:outer membrane protein assembly factor BamA